MQAVPLMDYCLYTVPSTGVVARSSIYGILSSARVVGTKQNTHIPDCCNILSIFLSYLLRLLKRGTDKFISINTFDTQLAMPNGLHGCNVVHFAYSFTNVKGRRLYYSGDLTFLSNQKLATNPDGHIPDTFSNAAPLLHHL